MLKRSIQSSYKTINRKSLTTPHIQQQQNPITLLLTRGNYNQFNKKYISSNPINRTLTSSSSTSNSNVLNVLSTLLESSDKVSKEEKESIIEIKSKEPQEQEIKIENPLFEYQKTILQLSKQNKIKDALNLLIQMSKLKPNPIYPDASCFNIVLQACIDNNNIDYALEVFELLRESHHNADGSFVVLDDISINTILHGLANNITQNEEKYTKLTNDFFKLLKKPNTSSYNALLKIQFYNQNISETIPSILKEMKSNGVDADEYTHAIIVQGYVTIGYVQEAYSYLSILMEYNQFLKISIHPFSMLIHALAKRNDVNGVIAVFNKIPKSLKPHTLIYNSLIDVHCRTNDINKAERVLNQMIKQAKVHGNDKDIYPSYFSFSSIITSYNKHNQPDRAEIVLKGMIKLHLEDKGSAKQDLTPDIQLFNSVLSSYNRLSTKHKDKSIPYQAKALLQEMIKLSQTTIPTLDPDVKSYCNVMQSFSNSKASIPLLKMEILQLYDKMLRCNDDPNSKVIMDSKAYNIILNAMAKCCVSNDEGENNEVIGIVKDILYKLTTDDKLTTDIISYNSIMNSFAKIGAAETAHKFLSNLLEPTSSIKPDIYTFNTVLHAYATACRNNPELSHEYAQNAEDLLHTMINDDNLSNIPYADNYSFNCVIDAWSQANVDDRGERAEKILDLMLWQSTFASNCKPDVRSYIGVIQAYGRANRISKAESTFQKLQTSNIPLNTVVYNSIINAIAKCRDTTMRNKSKKAYKYLQEMKDNNIPCDTLTYNFVINACAFTTINDEKKEAFDIAKNIMKYLLSQNFVQPDVHTFVTLLDAYINLLPYSKMDDANSDYINEVFYNARRKGLVSDFLLGRMKKVLDANEYKQLVPRVVPKQWYCKVNITGSMFR